MGFMIEFLGVAWNDRVLNVVNHTQTDKVVVPHHVVRDHEETHETL